MVRQINLADFEGCGLVWWTVRQWKHTIGCLIAIGLSGVSTYICYLTASVNGQRMLDEFPRPANIWYWLFIVSPVLIALFLPGCKNELKRAPGQWQTMRVACELNRQLKRADGAGR